MILFPLYKTKQTMKSFLKIFGLTAFIFYLIFSFINLSFNPFTWELGMRAGLGVFWVGAFIVLAIFKNI